MQIGKFEINKKLFIALIVVIVLSIISLIVKNMSSDRYNKYKIDKDKEFIYTYISYGSSKTYVPYVNLDTEFADNLNKQIQKVALNYKDSNTSNNSMSYRFNNYQNILSLVLIFKSIDSNNQLQFDFKTYVFDLGDKARVLSDQEMLNLFDVTTTDVNNALNKEMKKKYNDEVKKQIISGSICPYESCYLKLREITNFADKVNYYIENGQLIVYRSFQTYSIYQEEEYFTRDDFKFVIK